MRTGVELPFPTVWPIQASNVIESREWATDVLRGYTGLEQRVKQRGVPREAIEFGFATLEARESELAQALIYGGQATIYAVPLWQYGTRIGVALSPGATSVAVADVDLIPYVIGGYALLWRDGFTWEIGSVQSAGAGAVVLAAGVANGWPLGTYIFPARQAFVPDRATIEGPSTRVSGGTLKFEVIPTP